MTGKHYYMTTLGDWQRHVARFATSHFIVLDSRATDEFVGASATADCAPAKEIPLPGSNARIIAMIEADEGVHLALEDEAAFEALPHPLAQKPISDAAQSALAVHGVPPGATTFDAAKAVARVHPLLRHRVF
jgi:hypothetical protein